MLGQYLLAIKLDCNGRDCCPSQVNEVIRVTYLNTAAGPSRNYTGVPCMLLNASRPEKPPNAGKKHIDMKRDVNCWSYAPYAHSENSTWPEKPSKLQP